MGSKAFPFSTGWQKFVVPKKVDYVTVELLGGGTGSASGGRVTGRIKVTPGQSLFVLTGGAGSLAAGSAGGSATTGGGGAGGRGSGLAGGRGGAGATAVRAGSTVGTVLAVAGGAGGTSGDSGKGGDGGALIGENGYPGQGTVGAFGNATGGTQLQGGNQGTSSLGVGYSGDNALDTILGTGGTGGSVGTLNTYGGGGGGGGYRAGGGGQAGLLGVSSAGGGGGGSSYVGGLIGYGNQQGQGATGNGQATFTWVDPAPANQPPSPPTEVKVGGEDTVDDQVTKSVGELTITAKIDDPSKGQTVRMEAHYTTSSDFSTGVIVSTSTLIGQGKRATINLKGLGRNSHYYVRLYTRDSRGLRSTNYTSLDFWTNRDPSEPELLAPFENATLSALTSTAFSWNHVDPDATDSTPDPQAGFEIRWRVAATALTKPGLWATHTEADSTSETYVADPRTFLPNLTYEWQVRTKDGRGQWGPWAITNSFFVTGSTTSPLLLSPVRNIAVEIGQPLDLVWSFRDPDPGTVQSKADVRYKPVDSDVWFTLVGTTATPGVAGLWTLPEDTLLTGAHYEWQVRTYSAASSTPSEWSESEFFWGVHAPGTTETVSDLVDYPVVRSVLGSEEHRVYIYDRGGIVRRGEVTPVQSLNWGRVRDDISTATVVVSDASLSADLLSQVHTWTHEVVIYRGRERVFEGPLTLITDANGTITLQAKDVMAWVYRRILRQGYDDSYRVVNGQQIGQRTVVERAMQIVMNALAPDDPNILQYLTVLSFPDDAGQSRVVADFSKMAWEEVDDMAANSGLDYVTVGRRIMLWDTHRPLGRLQEMRTQHFSDPPIITEYGMQLATAWATTNNSGVYGIAEGDTSIYGLVEQLASAYGETETSAEEVLTSAAREALERTLTDQSLRSISHRKVAPVVVRVPDNATLSPETPVGINQLVPGVWIPVRAKGSLREVAQWQKLDSVTVSADKDGEKISVVMSPAPNSGEDPDAETTEGEES